MKIVRILLSIVLLLLVVVVLAFSALYYFIDPNKLKPVIITEVKKQTGYTLSIDDALSWTIYPRIAVYVPRMKLTAPDEAKPFADLEGTSVAVDVAQLLHGSSRLKGDIHIARLTLMDLHFDHVDTVLHWQEDILSLNPIKASLYQGTLNGVASVHFVSNQLHVPNWTWNVALNHVQFEPLMADLNPDSKLVIAGVGKLEMRAMAQGRSRSQMIVSLNGDTRFTLDNGAIEGIDLNYLVRSADALMNKQPLPEPPTDLKTNFDSFTGSVVLANGVATITSAKLISPAFTTTCQGEIDLMSSAIDVKLNTTPRAEMKTQWDIPVAVTGTLNHPNVALDSDQLARDALKQKIDMVKDKAREAIKKHIPGEAGKYLQKLLGQ